jgi:GntR family transcriptional regulator / MocR family aminotransferase
VHVTPAHQAPLGMTMPVSRRLELLAWAEEAGCWLIEDDYDSEFSYDSAPLPALKSLDVADRVIHCGSFNKTLFAGLRIGYAVVPRQWIPDFTQAMRVSGHSNSVLEQMALSGLLESGAFARHVRRARAVYAQRRDAVVEALGEAVGGHPLQLSGQHCGFHFVWWLPAHIDPARFLVQAESRGMRFENIADFCHRVTQPPGLVIGFSALQDAALQTQLASLRELLLSMGAKSCCRAGARSSA